MMSRSPAIQTGYEGKVAFVTGAAQGFGREFVRAFHAAGASVVLADVNGDNCVIAARELESFRRGALAVECDVTSESDVEAAISATATRFGRLDILVNNAGLHLTEYNQPFGSLGIGKLRRLLDVNVVGVVNCSIAASGLMGEGSAIVNISSIGGFLSSTPYGVSKLAVRGLTVALANELASRKIRVNSIAPGLMATENAITDLPADMVADFVENRQLIHRVGKPRDIVATLMFLCSDEASFITGETIRVSGGYPSNI